MIQAMICSSVLMSGPQTSFSGPQDLHQPAVYRGVSRDYRVKFQYRVLAGGEFHRLRAAKVLSKTFDFAKRGCRVSAFDTVCNL
jgi:hypothetical protein